MVGFRAIFIKLFQLKKGLNYIKTFWFFNYFTFLRMMSPRILLFLSGSIVFHVVFGNNTNLTNNNSVVQYEKDSWSDLISLIEITKDSLSDLGSQNKSAFVLFVSERWACYRYLKYWRRNYILIWNYLLTSF